MSSVELEQKLKPKLHEAKKTGKLNLSYSELKELPQGLSSKIKITTNLVELDLRSNTLVSLPDDIVELRMLRVVKLNYNKFTTVPHILINLPRLQVLEMSGNLLTEVPEHVAEMQALKELDLSGNQLSTLNPAITRLDHLTTLNLENNLLIQLPEDIGSMKSLARLDCNTNRLSVLPSSLGKCVTLIKVDLRANSLSTVPPSMGHLPNLKEFDLRYNLLKEPYKSKYEEGLAKFSEFLREEEERLRQEEIERLKPVGIEVGFFTEFKVKMEGKDCPTVRLGHSIVHTGNTTYVFGGLTDEGKVNDLYIIDMDTMDWKRPKTTGPVPCARDGHCAAVDGINNRMFVFGGRSAEKKRLNDLYYLDLKTREWVQPACEGTWPAPREAATAAITGSTLILFGGHGSGQRFNEVHFLDLETWTWSQPVISGSSPAPRESCAGCMDGPLLFLHGGKNNFVLGDAYVLDTEKLRWGQLVTDGRVPPPRFGHQSYVARCAEYQRMYIFGGMDELGGQCFSMFYLDLSGVGAGAGAASGVDFDDKLTRTWVEANTDLSFNAHRTFVFHNQRIHIYQHHSPFLKDKEERDKAADTGSRGAPCWDVFKVASLADFGAVVSSADNGKPVNAKSARINHTVRTRNVPASFYTNSPKEKAMLDHVELFRKRFIELYPRRRPLLLCPPNECDVRKFLCTTVRPTKLGYKSLYDWRTCAGFLADFLTYEPLEDPINYPAHIPSPWSVLQWQGGDSFDFAVALTSLLLGVGYDALCVVGYAPLAVTSNDQSREECPILVAEAERERAEEHARRNPPPTPKQTKYITKELPAMESAFLKFLADRKAADAAAKEAREAKEREAREVAAAVARGEVAAAAPTPTLDKSSSLSGAATEPADKLYGKRLHAWVLVLAGRREVTESFFVEPTTGLSYGVESSPYEGIELVWNQRNLWVNMQARFLGPVGAAVMGTCCNPAPAAPPSPDGEYARRTHYLTGMSFNLWESSKWEAVLEDNETGSYVGSSAGAASTSGSRGGGLADGTMDDDGDDEGGPVGVPPGVPAIPKPGSAASLATTIRRGSSNAAAEAAATDAAGGAGAPGAGDADGSVGGGVVSLAAEMVCPEMPPSWVPKLQVAPDAFDMRCPKGSKGVVYRRALHEVFAMFGECSRWDGMVSRLTRYADDSRATVCEVREQYSRRKDRLVKRVAFPVEDKVLEYFEPGAHYGLKELCTVAGKQRVAHFYPKSRLDGLVSRSEEIGRKTVEVFQDRDDRMVYRSVTYDPAPPPRPPSPQAAAPGAGAAPAGAMAKEREAAESAERERRRRQKKVETLAVIRKMTEKFSREPTGALPASKDVAMRRYYVASDSIRIDFHYEEERISFNSRTYTKEGLASLTMADPLEPRPGDAALVEENQRLLLAEKECANAVREMERESRDMVASRNREEQAIQLVTPYYDVVRVKQEEADDEGNGDEAKQEHDYLMAFLPAAAPGGVADGPAGKPVIGGGGAAADMGKVALHLTRSEAMEVRDRCLKALKDRLIERANIIQARHDEETMALAKRQANFARDRDQMSRSEEEEYEKACEESMFRIHILEQRLKRHEEQALHKYYELDNRLRRDPRLAALLDGPV